MLRKYGTILLKLFTIGFVMAAGVFWAGSGVDSRPKYRDEQTLVGGAIWSQVIIPMGLMISVIVDDNLHLIVHGYFLIVGAMLLISTGLLLVICEWQIMKRQKAVPRLPRPRPDDTTTGRERPRHLHTRTRFDRMYFTIGVLCIVASIFMFIDFWVVII